MNKFKTITGVFLAGTFLAVLSFSSCKKENLSYSTTSGPAVTTEDNQSLRQIPVESGRGCQGDPCAYTTAKDINDAANLGYVDLDLDPAYSFRDNVMQNTLSGPAYIACFYDVSKLAADQGLISASNLGQWWDMLSDGLDAAKVLNGAGNDNVTIVTDARYDRATALLDLFKPYSNYPSCQEQLEILDDVLQDTRNMNKADVLKYLDVE